jgi:hypothetical protein
MYPSPDDPESVRFHVMKGAHLIVAAGKNQGYTNITITIPVADLEMAKEWERAWEKVSGSVLQ